MEADEVHRLQEAILLYNGRATRGPNQRMRSSTTVKQSQGERRRTKLFYAYAVNLHDYLKATKQAMVLNRDGKRWLVDSPVFQCPLCLGSFIGEVNVQGDDPFVNEEHNPPRHVGGKAHLLTCKSCNGSHGLSSDHFLGTHVDVGPFLNNEIGGQLPGRLFVDDMNMPSRLERLDDNTVAIHIDQRLNQYVSQQIMDRYERVGQVDLRMHFTLPNNDQLNLAYLKIAHLEAFRRFGYSYLLSENGRRMVQTLQSKKKEIPFHGRLEVVSEQQEDGLYYVEINRIFHSLAIVYTVKTKKAKNRIGVLIPGHGPEAWESYLSFRQFEEQHVTVNFARTTKNEALPNYRLIPDRYQKMWEHCLEHLRKAA